MGRELVSRTCAVEYRRRWKYPSITFNKSKSRFILGRHRDALSFKRISREPNRWLIIIITVKS